MEQVTKIRKIFLNYELKKRRGKRDASTGSATGKEKREERREKIEERREKREEREDRENLHLTSYILPLTSYLLHLTSYLNTLPRNLIDLIQSNYIGQELTLRDTK